MAGPELLLDWEGGGGPGGSGPEPLPRWVGWRGGVARGGGAGGGEGLGSAPGRRAAGRRLPPAITGPRQAADGTPVGVGTGEG